MEQTASTRLNKHLALQLGVSRREADDLIAAGKVTVNGSVATLGSRVQAGDAVTVGGKSLTGNAQFEYVLFNKPVGYVCSRRPQGDTPTIYSLLPQKYHALKPVGRLDKDSSGLILLTNDGDFAHRMTHPSFQKAKVYEVQLDKPLAPLHQQMISDYGVMLPDGPSKFLISRIEQRESQLVSHKSLAPSPAPAGDTRLGGNKLAQPANGNIHMTTGDNDGSDNYYEVHMSEGRNRQIRRTFAALGYTVTALHRTQFGNYSLGDIKSGEHILTNIL